MNEAEQRPRVVRLSNSEFLRRQHEVENLCLGMSASQIDLLISKLEDLFTEACEREEV